MTACYLLTVYSAFGICLLNIIPCLHLAILQFAVQQRRSVLYQLNFICIIV